MLWLKRLNVEEFLKKKKFSLVNIRKEFNLLFVRNNFKLEIKLNLIKKIWNLEK